MAQVCGGSLLPTLLPQQHRRRLPTAHAPGPAAPPKAPYCPRSWPSSSAQGMCRVAEPRPFPRDAPWGAAPRMPSATHAPHAPPRPFAQAVFAGAASAYQVYSCGPVLISQDRALWEGASAVGRPPSGRMWLDPHNVVDETLVGSASPRGGRCFAQDGDIEARGATASIFAAADTGACLDYQCAPHRAPMHARARPRAWACACHVCSCAPRRIVCALPGLCLPLPRPPISLSGRSCASPRAVVVAPTAGACLPRFGRCPQPPGLRACPRRRPRQQLVSNPPPRANGKSCPPAAMAHSPPPTTTGSPPGRGSRPAALPPRPCRPSRPRCRRRSRSRRRRRRRRRRPRSSSR